MAKKQGSGGGSRKRGRNSKWCLAYKNSQQREKNKAIRLARHLRRHPEDPTALTALTVLPTIFVKRARKMYE